jgi:hypothetical protein
MSVQMTSSGQASDAPTVVSGEVTCALTGRTLRAEEAYWAPPLITARQLVTSLVSNVLRTPGNLGHVLFEEQPNVPYHPEARQLLASRRTAEQLKLLLILLAVAAVIVVPLFWFALG